MNNLIGACLPICLIILSGIFAEKFDLIGKDGGIILSRFVFYFTLPVTLFVSTAVNPVYSIFNLTFITIFTVGSIFVYCVGFMVFRRLNQNSLKYVSIVSLMVSFPNTVFMGLPILNVLFGKKAILPVTISTVIMKFITMISIIIIESIVGNQDISFRSVFKIIKSTLINPLVLPPIVGLIFAIFNIPLLMWVNNLCNQISQISAPCSLFAIGLSLGNTKIFRGTIETGVICLIKLIIHPLVVLLLIFVFRLDGVWAASCFILSALPTASIVYIIANNYQVASNKISVLTLKITICSLFTVSFCIMIAKYLWPIAFIT